MKRRLIGLPFLLLICATAVADESGPRFPESSRDILTQIDELNNDTEQPDKASEKRQTMAKLPKAVAEKTVCLNPEFLICYPAGYDKSKQAPLLIFLHGRGERGADIDRVKRHGPPKLLEAGESFPFIVVSPQCLTLDNDKGWWNTGDLDLLLAHIQETHNIDSRRIYLTGLSMGGFGSWAWAAARPKTFAAIAPICGGADYRKAKQLADLPIWVFHGKRDRVVPWRFSEEMVKALREHGSKVKLTIYPEANHDSWTETYNNKELYKWFMEHQAPKQP